MNAIRQKIDSMFPTSREQIPANARYAETDLYPHGDRYLINGKVLRWSGETTEVRSPICINGERALIGQAAKVGKEEALAALEAVTRAWDRGRGRWPTMRVAERIACVQAFVDGMKKVREETVRLLMWEIGKTRADSEKEFDRTVEYVVDTIEALKELDRQGGRFQQAGGVLAQIRRSPLGPTLCMGPFNYPLNETFTTLIPALIMGNPVVCKLPRFGVLCQAPLLDAFASAFPPGVVNVINGDGPVVVPPLLESGQIAALAFIGTTKVANLLKRQHPRPNRMRCILGLEAKNPAIVLGDADLDLAVAQCVQGALSFNGQRCTGLKLLWVSRSNADAFVSKLSAAIDKLAFGMPWDPGAMLTPLPEPDKPERLARFVANATSNGAQVANEYGGLTRYSFYFPSVVYPVRPGMALYSEEQFGPVVPVAVYDDLSQVIDWITDGAYGQQASVFGNDPTVVGPLIDVLVNQVCRVNLNAQCQRGPDQFPFTGRKDSAEGTLSVTDALRCFSIRSMVAAPSSAPNRELLRGVLGERSSNFVSTDYIF
jgi:glyceraldehyde-3-phosphate dehydrogenase (NADP+)